MSIQERLAVFLFRNRLRGASRFHAKICGARRLRVKSKHGVVMALDPHEYVDGFILREGYYEEEVLRAITSHLAPGEVFWDIGSNLGLHALTVAKLKPGTFVHAFEPNPAMVRLIHAAAKENRLSVDVMDLALDSSAGTATFYLHSGNAGRSGLHNWDEDPALAKIQVITAKGDEIVTSERAASPHVIKIDVEGNEQRVFEGMPGILSNRKLHTVVFEDSPFELSGTKKLLDQAGFEIRPLTRLEATHHALANFIARRT